MTCTIAIPAGADIRVAMLPPHHLVLVAPPPLKADVAKFLQSGVSAVFTFDDGMNWPDQDCCRYAEQYLRAGIPICFEFGAFADALTCHRRLLQEAGR